MDIHAALEGTPPPPIGAPRGQHPTGREYEWDGNVGWLRTEPLTERPKTWDEFIRDAGLDPAEVEVLEPVQIRGWDMPVAKLDPDTKTRITSVVRAHYYRLNLRRRALEVDVAELVKAAKRRRAGGPPELTSPERAFLLALGDLQLGKMDGDGVDGTVDRFLAATDAAVARYKRIAKGSPAYLVHLGDCIEGFLSQGGANTWRTRLTTTEQVDLYQYLLLEQVKAFSAVAPELTVVGIPGNHDEAHRPLQTYTDSWALQSVNAVRRACDLAGTYDHVRFYVPARDELTCTLDIAGTIVGMAHGHQFRTITKALPWWANQAHSRQPIGDAHLLLSAHFHHLRVEHTGSDKTWIQVPALESGSQWWKHRTGEWGQPGVVTALVGGGGWHALEVL